MRTGCAYCSIRIPAIAASTLSVTLRTSRGGAARRGSSGPPSRGSGRSSAIAANCTRGFRLFPRVYSAAVRVSDFDFDLPEDLIAQEARPRGASRLLVLDRRSGAIEHTAVSELPRFCRAGDQLVVNDTRVFAARLLGRRVPSGGAVECLLLRSVGPGVYEALMHPGQKLKPAAIVQFEGPAGTLMAEVLERRFFGRRTIRLWSASGRSVDELIDALGHVPLPPYIKRTDTAADRERYQ